MNQNTSSGEAGRLLSVAPWLDSGFVKTVTVQKNYECDYCGAFVRIIHMPPDSQGMRTSLVECSECWARALFYLPFIITTQRKRNREKYLTG